MGKHAEPNKNDSEYNKNFWKIKGFLNKYGINVLLFLFIIPFSVFMVFLGIEVISLSHDIYEKSVLLSQKAKVPICNDCIKFGYTQATSYFMLALGGIILAVLLPNLQSISFGGASITLKALTSDVNDLKTQNNDLQEKIINTGGLVGKAAGEDEKTDEIKAHVAPIITYLDDPQKGKWGGYADSNGRHLRAEVSEAATPGYFKIRITVTGDPDNPISGLVKFHLHNTFRNPDPVIAVKNNIAELKLNRVYGAFTVGAEVDNGRTKLELDLANLEGAPKKFRES